MQKPCIVLRRRMGSADHCFPYLKSSRHHRCSCQQLYNRQEALLPSTPPSPSPRGLIADIWVAGLACSNKLLDKFTSTNSFTDTAMHSGTAPAVLDLWELRVPAASASPPLLLWLPQEQRWPPAALGQPAAANLMLPTHRRELRVEEN